jgi:glycerate 2-kinase
MQRTPLELRRDALAIWNAGLSAVRSDELVRQCIQVVGQELLVDGESLDLNATRRIIVVGAGKAGAGMAAGLEAALGPELMAAKQVSGWINVPADCVRPLARIHLHAARPAGVNEPMEDGVRGAQHVLRLVEQASPDDLCIALISGGGSALLPLPVEEISLSDKLAVTRHLSAAGASIEELNAVRKRLSRIKGGGLARACRAGRLVTLIISDVLGDPRDVIASGPTVPDRGTAADALAVLERYQARQAGIAPRVFEVLQRSEAVTPSSHRVECQVSNHIIGNNAVAVDAAGLAAERLGYSHAMVAAARSEGPAEDVGRHLAEMALQMRTGPGPDCLISGGEPVVRLAPESERGLGGRNQQLVLAAVERLWADKAEGLVLLSAGTDGEDGPTSAAGAILDAELIAAAQQRHLEPADFLRRNDAYRFFQPLGGLIETGPTHTNVCDVRVVLTARRELDRR